VKRYWAGLISGMLFMAACSSLSVDRSMQAVEAGDYTLAMSACEALPGGGMDVCRVREGEPIESSWKLVIPEDRKAVQGWEVDVYFRDGNRPAHFQGQGPLVELPWKEFLGQSTWTKDLDGEAMALLLVRYKLENGIEEIVKFRGLAKLVVTAAGYDRLPIDSGFAAWKTSCKVQYSTAGRSAVKCQ
jgi:hypothetical protein